MNLSDFASQILMKGELSDKLVDPTRIIFDEYNSDFTLPKAPVRCDRITISTENIKFPRGHFHLKEKKAIALHSFANHELLACEMMAAALLLYPHDTDELIRFKRGIISTIKDEQKHLKLYIRELNKLGYEFGDFALNDFFWSYMSKLETPAQYTALMALTFEAANLDFAAYYEKIFRGLGEDDIANVLAEVLKDEISHVGFGVRYMNKWREDKDLWNYYQENLPWPMTPARAKGKVFERTPREKAGLDENFLEAIEQYKDDFSVTSRREWKQ